MSYERSFDHRFKGIIKRITTVWLWSDLSPDENWLLRIFTFIYSSAQTEANSDIFLQSLTRIWRASANVQPKLSRYGRHPLRCRSSAAMPGSPSPICAHGKTRCRVRHTPENSGGTWMPLTRCSKENLHPICRRLRAELSHGACRPTQRLLHRSVLASERRCVRVRGGEEVM